MTGRTLLLAALVAAPAGAQLQTEAQLIPGDTILATPVGRYPAGALHRWVLGNGWRELWETPVPAPVLDLDDFAGGLEPIRVGGGQQTRSLRLRGADGVVYNFRSIDKDAARTLDPILRTSLAAEVLQDQIASLFPLSSMVVAPLLDAAGVFHPGPRLVVMPSAADLPGYEGFAGLLGWIEVRPDEGVDDTAGFEGSRRVVGTPRLFERVEEGSDDLVDQEAFLRARLMDFLVGDWDRHPDQWRWAGFEAEHGDREVTLFRPIPRDRDWALARLDGAFTALSWIPWPQYMGFADEVPRAFRISWNGRGLDRRYLNALERDAFLGIARDVQAAITDEVIDRAVGTLPAAYESRVGDTLRRALRTRRDGLVRLADEFYRLHAGWVDVDQTDEDELTRVERAPDGSVRVRVFDRRGDGTPRAEPWYERRFVADETREVRLYLRGGDDTVEIEGSGPSDIRVRVIGGGGDDRMADRTGGGRVHFYDHRGDNRFETARGTRVDTSDHDPPEDEESEQHGARPRDWGARWIPLPVVSYATNDGLVLGLGAQRTGYGFRHYPYESRLAVRAAVGVRTGRGRLALEYDFGADGDRLRNRSGVSVSAIESNRFYGFGNGTAAPGDDDLYQADRTEISAWSTFVVRPTPGSVLEFGPRFEAYRPWENENTAIAALRPYGFSDFEQLGAVVALRAGSIPSLIRSRTGTRFEVEASLYPKLFDVGATFGAAEAHLTHYLGLGPGPTRSEDGVLIDAGAEPTLALRAGARRVWGDYPWHSAATLGGARTLRGWATDRFSGDAMVYGGAELRIRLGDGYLLLPADFGLIGVADVGRVFAEDVPALNRPDGDGTGYQPRGVRGRSAVPSDDWHTAGGGGVWIQWVDFASASLTVVRGGEQTGFYFAIGMPF